MYIIHVIIVRADFIFKIKVNKNYTQQKIATIFKLMSTKSIEQNYIVSDSDISILNAGTPLLIDFTLDHVVKKKATNETLEVKKLCRTNPSLQ